MSWTINIKQNAYLNITLALNRVWNISAYAKTISSNKNPIENSIYNHNNSKTIY